MIMRTGSGEITADTADAEVRSPGWAVRLIGAASGTGIVVGVTLAVLYVLFVATDAIAAARILLVAVPVALIALVGWRLVADMRGVGRAPANRWLVAAAATGAALLVAVQVLPRPVGSEALDLAGYVTTDLPLTLQRVLGVLALGTYAGLFPGLATGLLMIAVTYVLKWSRVQVRITVARAQLLLAVVAMVVTAVLAATLMSALDAAMLAFLAVALAGAGAVLTSRWVVTGRPT